MRCCTMGRASPFEAQKELPLYAFLSQIEATSIYFVGFLSQKHAEGPVQSWSVGQVMHPAARCSPPPDQPEDPEDEIAVQD